MTEFLMKPKIDFAFKEIMMNENARIGFLSAILKIKPEEIKSTQILNTYFQEVQEEDKQGILDVRILMNNNTEINVEIQLSEQEVQTDRLLFYISKMYTEQIKQRQSRGICKKCVSISIQDCILFPKETEFYSCFHFKENKRDFIYTDEMEFHVIELPKLPKEIKEDSSDIELWAKFINAEKKAELEIISSKNSYIQSAYRKLQMINQDKEKQLEYEARIESEKKGRIEGENRVNRLNYLLLQNKRYNDLERSTKDYDFQKQLMREYGIIDD